MEDKTGYARLIIIKILIRLPVASQTIILITVRTVVAAHNHLILQNIIFTPIALWSMLLLAEWTPKIKKWDFTQHKKNNNSNFLEWGTNKLVIINLADTMLVTTKFKMRILSTNKQKFSLNLQELIEEWMFT